VAVRQYMHATL